MLKTLCCGWFLLISVSLFSQKNALPKLKTGSWTGNLQLAENVSLPFTFVISKTEKGLSYSVFNESEESILINPVFKKDSRLVVVKMSKPTSTEWVQWAIDKGVNASVIAFVNNYPQVMDSFLDYEKGGKFEGKDQSKDNGYIFNPRSMALAYATPRSLVAASDILDEGDGVLDDETLEAALIGTIGATTAEALSSFVRFGRDICPLERVLKDPATAPLSDNPTAQLVQVFQFVSRVDKREDAEKIVEYVWRMKAEMQSIFCNSVAQSQRVSVYVTLANFGKMLAAHKIFFSTK